jgi:hypothetical protein
MPEKSIDQELTKQFIDCLLLGPEGENRAKCYRCGRPDIVRLCSEICSHVVAGAPIEHVFYQCNRTRKVNIWVSAVLCGESSHEGKDLLDACPDCLTELLWGHPKGMTPEKLAEWEAQEERLREDEEAEELSK